MARPRWLTLAAVASVLVAMALPASSEALVSVPADPGTSGGVARYLKWVDDLQQADPSWQVDVASGQLQLSSSEFTAIEESSAVIRELDKLYSGDVADPLATVDAGEVGTAATADQAAIDGVLSGTASGDATEAAVGGEAADVAQSAGILGDLATSATLAGGLAVAAGAVGVSDIVSAVTGRPVGVVKLFDGGDTAAVAEAPNGSFGQAVAGQAWLFLRRPPAGSAYFGPGGLHQWAAEETAAGHLPQSSGDDGLCGGQDCSAPYPVIPAGVAGVWVLVFSTAGGATFDGTTVRHWSGYGVASGPASWPWALPYVAPASANYRDNAGDLVCGDFAQPVSGWPPRVPRMVGDGLVPGGLTYGSPCANSAFGPSDFFIREAWVYRVGARMHVGLPRADGSPANGGASSTVTGTPLVDGAVPGAISALDSALNDGSHGELAQLLDGALGNSVGGSTAVIPGYTAIPDACSRGGVLDACVAALSAAGLGETTESLPAPAPGVTGGRVVSTVPLGSAAPGSSVTVQVQPLVVPQPKPNEVIGDYRSDLATAGISVVSVDQTRVSAQVGPNVVTGVTPAPGTAVSPTTQVIVQANPADAPAVGLPAGATPGSPGCFLTPPSSSIDLSPITGLRFGSAFPFSVVPWIANTLGGVAATGQRPQATISVFGQTVSTGDSTAPLDPVFQAVRTLLAVLLWIGVTWSLWRRTFGGAREV